jgi:hypothetical protein
VRPALAAAAFFALLPSGVLAAEDCTADITDAQARLAAIQARDPKIDALMKQKNVRAVCVILRGNIVDMTAARDAMARCLPEGSEKNQDVTTLNANLSDLSDAVATQCAAREH